MREVQEQRDRAPGSAWRRLGWFVAIWAAGVLALGAVAWLLRQFMSAIGMG